MNSQPTASTETRPRRWVAWLVGILLTFFIIGVIAWVLVKGFIETQIQTQLADLDLGDTRIGNISVSTSGVTAHDIEFKRNPDDQEPWLKVGRLNIQHPISELASGATTFNGIQLNDAQATIDLDNPPWPAPADDAEDFSLDLSQLQLPANAISVTDSNFRITQGQQSVDVSDVDLTITQTDDTQTISGQIGDLLGGPWKIQGQIDPSANEYTADITANDLQLDNDSWQQLPYVPPTLKKYFTADGSLRVAANVSGNGENPAIVDGNATIKKLDLNLPTFNLPITVTGGDVNFDLTDIKATDIRASIDGQDQLQAAATVNIDGFPLKADFETGFDQLAIASLRRIVPGIPETLSARADGTATGRVTVQSDTRTTIAINAQAKTQSAAYGDLQAQSSQTSVVIESLIFDARQNYESITGNVVVDANAARQPIENVFTTFDIESLSTQLDLTGTMEGQAKIELPLATIEDLKTWGLSVTGQMPTGTLGGQSIRDAKVDGRFNRGVLELSPVTAVAEIAAAGDSGAATVPTTVNPTGNPIASAPMVNAPKSNAQKANGPNIAAPNLVSADIAWPLVEATGDADDAADPNGSNDAQPVPSYGSVTLKGVDVPTAWTAGLIENQITNATGQSPWGQSDELTKQMSQIGGDVNFDAVMKIPADSPDDITKWLVDGNVRDTDLSLYQRSLNGLNTRIGLADGKLTLSQIAGRFDQAGNLSGNAVIDLNETAAHQIDLDAKAIPLRWLVTACKNASPEFATEFNRIAGLKKNQPLTREIVGGDLDIDVDFQSHRPGSPTPWSANVNIGSQRLNFAGETLRKLQIEANSDSKDLIVKRIRTNLGDRGSIDGTLQWDLQRNSGDGNLNWKSLSIATLTKFAAAGDVPVTGLTDGQLNLASIVPGDKDFDDDTIPVKIDGQVAAVDLTAGKIRVKPFRFDIATRSGKLLVENFQTENEAVDFDLNAQADLKTPFAFSATGTLGKLQLSRLLKQSSVTQKEGEVVDVSGIMSGKFEFIGRLAPLEICTQGQIKIDRPSYHNKPLQDIAINWEHTRNDWTQSKLRVDAFGGVMKMVELTQTPQHIGVDVKNIDALEVTSLFNLPLKLKGKLAGTASFDDWDVAQTRRGELELRGSSLLVSEVKIGDFTGTVDYRNDKLTYGILGALLGGKFKGEGETSIGNQGIEEIEFPITFTLNNALLGKLDRKSAAFRGLRNLDGNVSAIAEFVVGLDRPFEGDGRIGISDAKWSNEILTRSASIHFNMDQDRILFNDVKADLKRGRINANAMIPISSNLAGTYECEVRQMDLKRIAAVASQDDTGIEGLFDARINGQIGNTISGQGYIGVERASLHGVNGQSVRLPVQFSVSTNSGQGRIELRRSSFRLFDGTASGTAKISFGNRTSIDADLKLSRIDTGKMMRSLADFDQANQGELNGRLKIKGSGLRSLRDLKGTFEGELQRASAFQLPVLADTARVLAGNQLQNDDFNSEDIQLQLDNGRVEIRSLNFASSLANVAITGFVFIDGRLDLSVAGRIERFNQPTLLEELAGSPLVLIRGTPASFFAQAADFLSDRVVFLNVGGTVNRPRVRVDTRQQLREETIRYFLRGSQILPTSTLGNN